MSPESPTSAVEAPAAAAPPTAVEAPETPPAATPPTAVEAPAAASPPTAAEAHETAAGEHPSAAAAGHARDTEPDGAAVSQAAPPAESAAPGPAAPAEPAASADPPTLTLPPMPEPAAPPPAPQSQRVAIGQVLPIYFVGDESHSMSGDPIGAVNQGLADLRDEVAKHPLIGKKVRFGIVTFAHAAEVRLPLSELSEDLALPTLAPRGRGTSYASAFALLRQTIPGDIAALKASGYQVHRPVVFFLTDGQPTEREKKWRSRLSELGEDGFRERPNILAFGVGEADPEVIRQIASSPRYAFMMRDGASTAGAISEFATSMLNSMVASAERLDRGEQTIEFEKPEGFVQLDAPLL
ncbi:MAG TPA: VWA domain-containing protein [Solirubrobacteraceae bacterium]|nr:VWA domain-containing protein [Solirubrobacteraceae bacterium]